MARAGLAQLGRVDSVLRRPRQMVAAERLTLRPLAVIPFSIVYRFAERAEA